MLNNYKLLHEARTIKYNHMELYQRASRFPFTTPHSVLNHVDAITLKRQNGPICETESHKTVILASKVQKKNCVFFQRK